MKSARKFKGRYDEFAASDFQKRGAEILAEVQHNLEPVIITRHEKPVAFIASMELFEQLEKALVDKLEEESARIKTMTRAIRKNVQISDLPEAPRKVATTASQAREQAEDRTVSVAITRKTRR